MDNQVSNNQIYIPKQGQQQQFQAKQNAAQQNQSYGNAKEVAINNTNAGYVASKFDVMQHPWLLLQNALMGLFTAVGITRLGNLLVKPNLDKLADGISHSDALEHTPLYKLGLKMDAVIEKTPFLKKSVEKMSEWKHKIAKTPKSQAVQEVISKYKDGSLVEWSMGKFYQDGKGSEAFEEFVEFLEKTPKDDFSDDTKKFIDEVLKDVKDQKISKHQGGKKIVDKNCLDEIKAKYLDTVKIGEGKASGSLIDRIFGTTPNLNSSLAKAKFFNGGTKGLGPVSKMFNKLSLMMLEGTGGGLLGGKMAMFMSVFGLISAYNACTKANVAKKEKEKQLAQGNLSPEQIKEMQKKPWSGETVSAFMEDFTGFTLGGYLMTFPIGVALNKTLGLANLGRSDEAVKLAAQKMGIQGTDKLYQRSIMKYNEALKHDKMARKYIDYLNGNGGLSIMGKIKKALGLSSDASIKAEMVEKLKLNVPAESSNNTLINALKTKTKDDKWFDNTRKMLKTTGKSNLTLKNVFSGKEGTLNQRLTKYAIQKPLELASKILGPDKFLMFKKGAGFTNKFRSLVNVGGGVGRILLVGMVLTVPFRNAFMKVSHGIFGKPSFSQYDEMKGTYEDKEEKNVDKVAPKTLQPIATQAQEEFKKIKLPQQPPIQVLQPEPAVEYAQKSATSNPFQNEIKSQDSYSYIPKNEILEDAEMQSHPVRMLDTYKYVPKA